MDQKVKRSFALNWCQIAAGLVILNVTAIINANVVTVVSPTSPLPQVVTAEGKVHQDAAIDLCDYLSRVSGREIKPGLDSADTAVTIHVGPDAFVLEHAPEVNDLYADGYLLKHVAVADRHHIILSGIRWQSSRWAVEEFLKQFCGVRWLFPGDTKYGEIVPSRPTLTVNSGLDQKHEPDYLSRSVGSMDFYAKDRNYRRLRIQPRNAFGNHEFQFIFTRDDYEKHPEWFALFTIPEGKANSLLTGGHAASEKVKEALEKGVRRQRWHWDYGTDWQICLSNPETIQHAIEYARDYLAKNPDAPVVSMGHNDNGGWCECDLCNAFAASVDPPYNRSEQYWHWVNQVAKELAKTHPDKKIATIAYGTPATPPRFAIEKNVTITVTVWYEPHLDLVKDWQKKSDSVSLYSYVYGMCFVGFRHYPHAMRDFLKWGHDELKAINHTSEVYGNWSFDGPKYHYMQALQWDVNADPDKIMDDYCNDWFGAAAAPMKVFWDRLEQIYERWGHPRRLVFYMWVGWIDGSYGGPVHYDEFDKYTLDDVGVLDKAIAKAEHKAGTEADRFRVARVADAWKYYRTLLLGKLKYADKEDIVLAEAGKSSDFALKQARELAALQTQKLSFHRQLRIYPNVNPQAVEFSTLSAVSVFCDMSTILDDLCDHVTNHLIKAKGNDGAATFWRQVKRDDPLYGSAQTQIYMIEHPERPNVLVNGDFETGDMTGWTVADDINVTNTTYRQGGYAAQSKSKGAGFAKLSQSIPVHPGQRYRLTIYGSVVTNPDIRMAVKFRRGDKGISPEPTYRRIPKMRSTDQWGSLQATFTVPPAVDTAVIVIKSPSNQVLLDDLTLEKILDDPVIEQGILNDDFSNDYIDESKWIESTPEWKNSRSGFLPVVKNGVLVFDDRPMVTLVSLSNFNELLSSTDSYRLRLHISKGDNKNVGASLQCGIQTGTASIKFNDNGFWFSHHYTTIADESPAQLRTYGFQDTKRTFGPWYDVEPANTKDRDIWYTFHFDKENIIIYAGTAGYTEKEDALVGKIEHKITNITSNGSVFLKLTGNNVRIHQISLTRSGPATVSPYVTEPIRVPASLAH